MRTHCVSVRLSVAELEQLDRERRAPRGAYLRNVWQKTAPSPVPEINAAAWLALSKVASNLNQIARAINLGDIPDLPAIRSQLSAFRASLLELTK